jgi:hypothetical protein
MTRELAYLDLFMSNNTRFLAEFKRVATLFPEWNSQQVAEYTKTTLLLEDVVEAIKKESTS